MEDSHHGRDAEGPLEIGKAGWRDILWRLWAETGSHNVGMLAAGVAFYAFLAFVPALGAMVLMYGLLSDPAQIGAQLQVVFHLLPSDAAKLVGDQMVSVTKTSAGKSGLGLAVALLLAIYGSMSASSAIISALNVVYDEEETRSLVHTYGLAIGISVALVLVGLMGVLAIGALAFLVGLMPSAPAGVILLIRVAFWLAAAVSASSVIAVIYRFAPDRRPAKWRWVAPGAAVATIAWLAMTLVFGLYATHIANYNATYGALGAVVGLLMWLYFSAFVILAGSELNAELERQTAKDSTRGPARPMGQRRAYVADTLGEPRSKHEPRQDGGQGGPEQRQHSRSKVVGKTEHTLRDARSELDRAKARFFETLGAIEHGVSPGVLIEHGRRAIKTKLSAISETGVALARARPAPLVAGAAAVVALLTMPFLTGVVRRRRSRPTEVAGDSA
jgi:membrane protein